jgi:hypothetical protein
MTGRHVWVQGDANVKVFKEDATGALVDFITGDAAGEEPDPIFTYCYCEGIRISASTAITRRAVTGRGRRKITTPAGTFDDVSIDVDHMFFRKAVELNLTDVFNITKQLRLVVEFTDVEYNGIAPLENDTVSLSFAFAQNFAITGRGADVVEAAAHFEAEIIS